MSTNDELITPKEGSLDLKDEDLEQVSGGNRSATFYQGLEQFYGYRNKADSKKYGFIECIDVEYGTVTYVVSGYNGSGFDRSGKRYKKSVSKFKSLYDENSGICGY